MDGIGCESGRGSQRESERVAGERGGVVEEEQRGVERYG